MLYLQITWLLIGGVAAGVFLFFARRHGLKGESRIIAIGLAAAALIYVGFALVGASTLWMFIELAGVGLFGYVAWMGRDRGYTWLAAGWGLHTVWDVALHVWGSGQPYAPEWYAWLCISFDLVVMAYAWKRAAFSRKN